MHRTGHINMHMEIAAASNCFGKPTVGATMTKQWKISQSMVIGTTYS